MALPFLLVRLRSYRRHRWFKWVALVAILTGALAYELKTAPLQSRFFAYYTSRLSYTLVSGASPRIVFPQGGPFDERRGYKQLPVFLDHALAQGYRISQQAYMSADLARTIRWGIAPPYREPPVTGLRILGARENPLFDASRSSEYFREFDEIPQLLAETLWFIENRELQHKGEPRRNPVIEWHRLAKASLFYVAHKIGLPVPLQGGSTLATQLEKFRHSPNGRTNSVFDKGRQIFGASLKAYRNGADTLSWRRAISVDYLNTMPLAAAPGYGEVSGLGEGLRVWFGLNLSEVSAALHTPGMNSAKISAYKHVLALVVSLRAPTTYLVRDHVALEKRANSYARLLTAAGVLNAEFGRAVEATPLAFQTRSPQLPSPSFVERKAINAVRADLLELLGVPGLYDLDRLHLEVETTIDGDLQREVSSFLMKLNRPDFVAAQGLDRHERLLAGVDPGKVTYSFLLYETTPAGNALRVRADSLNQPFDVNRGVKLELGSTAKLRVFAHYLELMAELYRELTRLDGSALADGPGSAPDPLSRWAAQTWRREKNLSLDTFLQLALDRRYSASPYEGFFTGGGMHSFENFSRQDNMRVMSVREALQRSTNLVFIRLMRDLVQFHQARLPYDASVLLSDPGHSLRLGMLEEIAEEESRTVLARAHKNYQGLAADDLVRRFLGKRAVSPRYLTILFFAWSHAREREDLARWLHRFMGKPAAANEIDKLWRAYSNPQLNLADYGYLLSRNSLEVWCAGQLFHEQQLSWNDLFSRSAAARRVASAWLFKTRNRHAQDVRLRTRIERDAFARMTPYWQRLGFPFAALVPSYATAIGNSADQPTALAELMGIILNDGVKRPALLIRTLHFAEGTPYDTKLAAAAKPQTRILDVEVARTLQTALASVVEQGTAQGVQGAFTNPAGANLVIGGKTGSGDNRYKTFNRYGNLLSSRAVNRTATFVFYLGHRYFGVISAFVIGPDASQYRFTSALPVTILKLMAPTISQYLAPTHDNHPSISTEIMTPEIDGEAG